ncbi:hypothetical protein GP486_000937 [Trichoglossum hirsutum]|uniref:Uncharacterized protein n=1 Tax=Trichoglossum hirsutum TaxID=265104 RepID=A0A9P8RT30_9PEZI|nr:hypothetical protein GP486_000937 [Trichoglossum hirsutum]
MLASAWNTKSANDGVAEEDACLQGWWLKACMEKVMYGDNSDAVIGWELGQMGSHRVVDMTEDIALVRQDFEEVDAAEAVGKEIALRSRKTWEYVDRAIARSDMTTPKENGSRFGMEAV